MHEIDALPVPEFHFAAIKERAERKSKRRTRRRFFVLAAFSVLLPALAAAAVNYFHPHVYRRGDTLHIYARSLTVDWRPSAATLAGIARSARYHVILPTALPPIAKLKTTAVADSELIDLVYSCPRKRRVHIMIAPGALRELAHPPPDPYPHVGMAGPKTVSPWHTFIAGDEIVRLETNCLDARQISQLRAAMVAAGQGVK